MQLISMKSVDLSFGGPKLFDDINLSVSKNEKISLIGRNGSGKSTLLKLFEKKINIDNGELIFFKELSISCLEQEIPKDLDGNIFHIVSGGLGKAGELISEYHQAILEIKLNKNNFSLKNLEIAQQKLENSNAWNLNQKVEKILSKLDLKSDLKFSSLSGGIKRKVLLARSLVIEPDLLLLDEPTNHLDIKSIEWLEAFLQSYQGTIIFVSHDRSFLSNISTRILEIDRGKIFSHEGDYQKYITSREKRWQDEININKSFDKKLAKEEIWIRQGIKARRTRNEGRVKTLEKLRTEHKQRKIHLEKIKFKKDEVTKSGKIVIEANNIGFSINNHHLFKNFSCVIERGQRVGIIGKNGSGKTTLLKILLSQLKPTTGTTSLGTKLKVSYFDQMRSSLNDELSVIDNLSDGRDFIELGNNKIHVISYLQDFLFTPLRSRTPVKALSGGEKNRLLLAKIFSKQANLLVLDEPTNDLDIETLELLEDKLQSYLGTILIVSHDRSFLNAVITSSIVFEDEGLKEYLGGYDDWIQQRKLSTGTRVKNPKTEKNKKDRRKSNKLTFNEKNILKHLPDKITEIEDKILKLNQELLDSNIYKNNPKRIIEIKKELTLLENNLGFTMKKWEELEEKN